MTTDQKKAFLLLKSVIFHHYGLEESENTILSETALAIDGVDELQWAQQFVSQDKLTAFERAWAYLNGLAAHWDAPTKLEYLTTVWESTKEKGYISEMEATTILKLAKDWNIQQELIALVRKKRNPN
ncbi:MAG: hypothetical protein V4714_14650 [Bacteroidota bacterium]